MDQKQETFEQEAFTVTGRVEGVFVCNQETRSTPPHNEKIELFPEGIRGDRHTGLLRHLSVRDTQLLGFGLSKGMPLAPTRQVSIVSVEEIREIEAELKAPGFMTPGVLGENLLVSGIPRLSSLPSGTQLCFHRFEKGQKMIRTAVIWVTAENMPCIIAGREVEEEMRKAGIDAKDTAYKFVRAAKGRRGVVGFVYSSGTIKTGDFITALIPHQRLYEP
jgi:hypothetical protein